MQSNSCPLNLKTLTELDFFVPLKTNINQSLSITSMVTDGIKIYVGSLNGVIRGWISTSDKHEGEFSYHKDVINSMILLNDGTMISTSDDSKLVYWNAKSYDKIRKFFGPQKSVTCCAVIYDKELAIKFKNPKGERIVFGGTWEGNVYVWDISNANPGRVLIHNNPIKKIVPFQTHYGKCLASGCHNGEIWIWKLEDFTTAHKFQAHLENLCHLGVYEGVLISSGKENSKAPRTNKIKIWDSTLNLIHEMETGREHINKFTMFHNRFLIVVSGIKTVEVWDVKKNKRVIDKCENLGIISEVSVINSETILVSKSHEVNIIRHTNQKFNMLKLLHKFRTKIGYPPVVVKLIYEAFIKSD